MGQTEASATARILGPIDNTATVETPERVRFRHRLAGPAQRGAAWLIDTMIQGTVVVGLAMTAQALSLLPAFGGVAGGVQLLAMFAVQWLYGVFFETVLSGRTPGKMVLELRVVREDGAPARFSDYLLRNLVRVADFLPLGFALGVVVMTLDPKRRRIGDLVGGTVVVAENRSAMLDPVRIEPPVTDEERQALPARVDLRPQEVEVIEAFLRRRRRIDDQRAQELSAQFGPALAARTGIDAPSWERVLALAYARATGRDRPEGEVPAPRRLRR
ncbi:MAG: RDD family protein [Myxococcota bacterium]